jgi:hypothetical protein
LHGYCAALLSEYTGKPFHVICRPYREECELTALKLYRYKRADGGRLYYVKPGLYGGSFMILFFLLPSFLLKIVELLFVGTRHAALVSVPYAYDKCPEENVEKYDKENDECPKDIACEVDDECRYGADSCIVQRPYGEPLAVIDDCFCIFAAKYRGNQSANCNRAKPKQGEYAMDFRDLQLKNRAQKIKKICRCRKDYRRKIKLFHS